MYADRRICISILWAHTMNENPRTLKMFRAWYLDQRKYRMSWEDWLYCGILVWLSTMGFALGFIVGWIWTLVI
jgi:hypothetical protein